MIRWNAQEMYRRYAHVVFRRCRALLHQEADAMDAMQDSFLRALRYHYALRPWMKPLPWLLQISNRVCFDRRQQSRERLQKTESLLLLSKNIGTLEPSPETSLALTPEQRVVLVDLLSQFDRLTQEMVVCYYLEEMSMEEIAEHVGRSRKTVGKILNRFREKVRVFSD